MSRKTFKRFASAIGEEQPIKKIRLANTLDVSFHPQAEKYPARYVWPVYFPRKTREDKQPTHLLCLGSPGCGKSNRLVNLLLLPPSKGGVYYDSCWYVTDATRRSGAVSHLRKEFDKMTKSFVSGEEGSTYKTLYGDQDDPNFTLKVVNSVEFAKQFKHNQIEKWYVKSGKKIPQHTIIVFDDAADTPNRDITKLLAQGRPRGISVYVVSQQFKQQNIPDDVRALIEVLMLFERPRMTDWLINQYVEKILKPTQMQVAEYLDALSKLNKGEGLIFNSDNVAIYQLDPVDYFKNPLSAPLARKKA